MKFGSVQFFKRLIAVVYLLLILIPTVAAVWLGVLYGREKRRAEALEDATLAEMAQILHESQAAGAVPSFDPEGLLREEAAPSFAYQALYPELYARRPLLQVAEAGVCYLTFDDGPSAVTRQILDTLEEYDIRATFFVTGENSEENAEVLRAAANAGHTIGVHSYSHNYEEVYGSVEAFLADFDKMYRFIEEATGTTPEIFRFPGGSINEHNRQVYPQIVAEMTRRGFVFYDWNASGSDAVKGGISAQQVAGNVLGAADQERLIVLLHDRADNRSTAAALPTIVEGLREQGFIFKPLVSTVEPITYTYTGTGEIAPNTE